ncbi:hypothetical protein DXG01_013127 [Tephrocybe rancida]|nr:hypothetical protein DXG01_013127 [Tephrocybe rancida]
MTTLTRSYASMPASHRSATARLETCLVPILVLSSFLKRMLKPWRNVLSSLDRKERVQSRTPKKLEIKGIFALDVDDAIWEDLRLDEGSPAAPPPWLSDEGVRAGIRALLEYDCCIEEKLLVNLLDFGNLALLPDWGPSAEDIINFRIAQKTGILEEAPTVHTKNNIKLERQEWDDDEFLLVLSRNFSDLLIFADMFFRIDVQSK